MKLLIMKPKQSKFIIVFLKDVVEMGKHELLPLNKTRNKIESKIN